MSDLDGIAEIGEEVKVTKPYLRKPVDGRVIDIQPVTGTEIVVVQVRVKYTGEIIPVVQFREEMER